MMTPTDKVLLEGRGFALSCHPWESLTPKGFLLAQPGPKARQCFAKEHEDAEDSGRARWLAHQREGVGDCGQTGAAERRTSCRRLRRGPVRRSAPGTSRRRCQGQGATPTG